MEPTVAPRKRKASIKSLIRKREKAISQQAALEAKRTAAVEIAVEKLDELQAGLDQIRMMLAGNGFAAGTRIVRQLAPVAPPSAALHPCSWCGRDGVMAQTLPNGVVQWFCEAHRVIGISDKIQEKEALKLMGTTTDAPPANPAKPAARKILMHPTAIDEQQARKPATMSEVTPTIDAMASALKEAELTE